MVHVTLFLRGFVLLPAGTAVLYQARKYLEAPAEPVPLDGVRQPHLSGMGLFRGLFTARIAGAPALKGTALNRTPTELKIQRNQDRAYLIEVEKARHLGV